MKRLWNKLRKFHIPFTDQNGFTLIEAIATIAIVGIVVTPIAMVFQGSLTSSIEAREQMKANQMGQQYVELLKAMDYIELKRLVDDYDGVISEDTITNGLFDLPLPLNNYDVSVDLHYDSVRDDSSLDADYNVAFDNPNYEMPVGDLVDAPLPNYANLIHLYSAAENGFNHYESGRSFIGLDDPNRIFATTSGERNILITYDYSNEARSAVTVKVLQNGVEATFDYVDYATNLNTIIYCDDTVTPEDAQINSEITVRSTIEEPVSILVYESVNDKVKPNINLELGTVKLYRGLSIVDISVNTHRIYEIEVTITKIGSTKPMIHVVTTRLAK